MAKKRPSGGKNSPNKHGEANLVPRTPRTPKGTNIDTAASHALLAKPSADAPLARAQKLMAQAQAEQNDAGKIELARNALAACPDCVDATLLLAEHAGSRREALALYEQGVAAGERALGPQFMEANAGRFWDLLETRPYMRAREGLVNLLWTLGRREEAAKHLHDMLRLNPNDNQALRYTLAKFLFFLDRDEELAVLLKRYPEDGSATWAYSAALLAFRREGDTITARRLLKQAKKANKHVPAYLLGHKSPAAEEPAFYSPGDRNDALIYTNAFMAAWKSTPGALSWLRSNQKPTKKKKQVRPAKGPDEAEQRWLQRLPQKSDIWQADLRPMPLWIQGEQGAYRPWIYMVRDPANDMILGHSILEEEPGSDALWDSLVQTLRHPLTGEPHRPAEIQVRPHPQWNSLRPHLETVGITLTAITGPDPFESLLNSLAEHLSGKPQTGLLDVPGIGPAQAARFYGAAAAFYRQAPWKNLGFDGAIKVECSKFEGGPWYALVMGRSGFVIGLVLHEDIQLLRKLWSGTIGPEDNEMETAGITVLFGEETDLPVADIEAAQKLGWEVARPDAYPEIFYKERGSSLRPPLAWELELMEGCLRAIPAFLDRRRQDDPTPESIVVSVESGELTLVLAWEPE